VRKKLVTGEERMIKVYTLVRTPWFSWLDCKKEFQAGDVTETFVPGDLKDLNYFSVLRDKPIFTTVFDSSSDAQDGHNSVSCDEY
jgi:hypothetical protein